MKKWNELDLKTKAKYIRTAVSHGLKSLDDIESNYNEFAEGGNEELPPITMPEITITPVGGYVNYTGAETVAPELEDYLLSKRKGTSVLAANRIINQDAPIDIPLSIKGNKRDTCINTATSQYHTPYSTHVVAGNKTFYRNPQDYGFARVVVNNIDNNLDRVGIGDIIQYAGTSYNLKDILLNDALNPHHATIVTGFNNGTPTVSYSNGDMRYSSYNPDWTPAIGSTLNTETIRRNLEYNSPKWNNSDGTSLIPILYKFVGTDADKEGWTNEYNILYGNRNINTYQTGGKTHTVKAGEVLGKIAELYGLTIDDILKVNKGLDANKILIGLTINIPNIVPRPKAPKLMINDSYSLREIRNSKPSTRKVDFKAFQKAKGLNARATDFATLELFLDSLIHRGYNEPLRLALLATAYNEMDLRGASSRGIGGNGILGLSKERMPLSYLGNTPSARGKLIHYILEDLGNVYTGKHSQAGNWNDGGSGGPTIMTGQDGYNKFNTATDANLATLILNKSYVRPAKKSDWYLRGNDAVLMGKHMKSNGGNLFLTGGDGIQEGATPDMTWHQNWLNNRADILGENIMSTGFHPIDRTLKYFNLTDDRTIGLEEAQKQIDRAKRYKEFYGWKEDIPKYVAEDALYGYKYDKEGSLSELARMVPEDGSTIHDDKVIYYPREITATGLDITKAHERAHALRAAPQLKKIVLLVKNYYGPVDTSLYSNYQKYLLKPTEIYSRLMGFRKKKGLNPKHKVTKKELELWEKEDNEEHHLFDLFDNDFLLKLFNEVAQNDSLNFTDKPNITAKGGKINLFLEGGDTYPSVMPKSYFQYTDKNGIFHDTSLLDLNLNWLTDMLGNPIVTNMPELVVTPSGSHMSGKSYSLAISQDERDRQFILNIYDARKPWIKPLAALTMAPAAITLAPALSTVISNPYVQTAFAADAAYRQGFTDEGIRKTARLINEGNYNDAVFSGLGDVMDLTMMSPILYRGTKLLNTRYIKPYKVNRAINLGVSENGIITGYNRNPRNLDTGSIWDYLNYLDEVFPNSLINDVLWHGGRPGILKFKSPLSEGYIGEHSGPFGNSTGQEGIYVSPDKDIAYRLRPRGQSEIYPVLINAENPYISNLWLSYPFNREGFTASHIRTRDLQGPLRGYDSLDHLGENAVWNPDQTLILGSNEDAIGFSNYMNLARTTQKLPNILLDDAYMKAVQEGDMKTALLMDVNTKGTDFDLDSLKLLDGNIPQWLTFEDLRNLRNVLTVEDIDALPYSDRQFVLLFGKDKATIIAQLQNKARREANAYERIGLAWDSLPSYNTTNKEDFMQEYIKRLWDREYSMPASSIKHNVDTINEAKTVGELYRDWIKRGSKEEDLKLRPLVKLYIEHKAFLESPEYRLQLRSYFKTLGISDTYIEEAVDKEIGKQLYNIETAKAYINSDDNLLFKIGDGMIMRERDAKGAYFPNTHTVGVKASNAFLGDTPGHEYIHASDLGEPYLDNANYAMTVKSDIQNPSYYKDIVELRPRVIAALKYLKSKGINYLSASDDEILDALLDVPREDLPPNVQSLVDSYEENTIPNAIRNFKSIIVPTAIVTGIGLSAASNQQALGGNLFLDGGTSLNWPALKAVPHRIVANPNWNGIETFIPNQTLKLFPNTDLTQGYSALNPYPGENVVIYNPNDKYINLDAITLDGLHYMHDNPAYQELFEDMANQITLNNDYFGNALFDLIDRNKYDKKGNIIGLKSNRELNKQVNRIIKDYRKGNYTDEVREYVLPALDGFLRRLFAPSYMNYKVWERGYDDPWKLQDEDALKVNLIKDFMESNILPEVIITPKSKGGNLFLK